MQPCYHMSLTLLQNLFAMSILCIFNSLQVSFWWVGTPKKVCLSAKPLASAGSKEVIIYQNQNQIVAVQIFKNSYINDDMVQDLNK